MDFGSIISSLLDQMAFLHLEAGSYVVIIVVPMFLYPTIKKGFEPSLLTPIAFGMPLINIYPDIIYSPEQMSSGTGEFLWHFFQLDEWSILSSFIFLGAGAVTDFSPLIANPISFPMGAVVQLDIYSAYFFAILSGFSSKGSVAISIIGGTDGPTFLFLYSKLGQTQVTGPIAVAVYSYVILALIIQPPLTRLLTTEKERKIKMEQLCSVSKLEETSFPIIVTIMVCLILPSMVPLVGIPILDNLLRESGVVKQPAGTISNALMCIVAVLLGTSTGVTTSAEALLDVTTIKIVTLGLTALILDTVGGVLLGKLLRRIAGGRINPLIGPADVSTAPIAARISQKVRAKADPIDPLLIYAVGPNVTGVTSTAVAAGTFMVIFGV